MVMTTRITTAEVFTLLEVDGNDLFTTKAVTVSRDLDEVLESADFVITAQDLAPTEWDIPIADLLNDDAPSACRSYRRSGKLGYVTQIITRAEMEMSRSVTLDDHDNAH